MAFSITLVTPNQTTYKQPTGLFINNEFIASKSREILETINPYDESVITHISAAGEEDVELAMQAARAAFTPGSEWRSISPAERGKLLWKVADLVERDQHILATIDAWDNGKPYQVALEEDVGEVIGVFRYYAGWADKVQGKTIDTGNAKLAYTKHEPVDASWRLGPALAGAALASHLDVDKIAFTGSTLTGKAIAKLASVNLKNITLETGGKSPLLVFNDADLDQAVKWSHIGIMSNMGQICTASSRIFVKEGVYEDFVRQFKDYTVQNTRIVSQFDPQVTHGPQVSKVQQGKILEYAKSAMSDGAQLILVAREEVFGPFVVVQSFKTESEAISKANDSKYGLGAAIFTRDVVKAHRVAGLIESGMVWINSSQDSHYAIPFGGYKQSGVGRELGEYALLAYTQVEAVHGNNPCHVPVKP
ncbi:uncharacterized protein BHQ10_010325 [Talaromyces amestolkiae]|uniref:Aldehyde dehydrogenase domain-containing protein n=1 Tax=Talaromyces amestolkiae TaxID=1196081 RepID=A0A364LEU5_TALAM|nr:uncharacterized protein BHQ10_010325 [Talaromyces amestolkiae]RAO74313.1 hypothetical protein BHQ10_010325 [Talaromyces amestolkiae]